MTEVTRKDRALSARPRILLPTPIRFTVSMFILAIALTPIRPAMAQAVATATGPDSSAQAGGGLSFFQQDYGKRQVAGGLVYIDIRPHWRYGLEGEARFLHASTLANVSQSTYLGGLKIIISPGPSSIQPYVKLLAGAAHITLPFGYASGTFAAYAPGAGVDVKLGDYFRLRLVDLEYQQWRNFPYGTLSPYGISSGISIRLKPLERFPKSAHRWKER